MAKLAFFYSAYILQKIFFAYDSGLPIYQVLGSPIMPVWSNRLRSHRRALQAHWLWIGCVLPMTFGLQGCERAPAPSKTETPHHQTAALQLTGMDVAIAEAVNTRPTALFTGTLQSLSSTTVQAQSSGQIRDVVVRVGTPVQQGEVLARINDQDSQARLLQAQANESSIQAQLTLAQNNLRRYEALFAKGFASRVELERAHAEATAQQQNLRAQQAMSQIARKAVADAVVRAPLTGWVTQRQINSGQMVQMGQTLFELMNPNDLEVAGTLSGNADLQLQAGQTLSFEVEGLPNQKFSAVLSRLNPATDRLSRTQTFFAQVQTPNVALRPGQFVRGTLAGSGVVHGVAIPAVALKNPDQPYVWVVRQRKLIRQPVQVIQQDSLNNRVLVKGLAVGEPVIRIELSPEAAGRAVVLPAQPRTAAVGG